MAGGDICRCGCGGETKGGRYLPGHDQKLRAEIERRAGGLEELRRVVKKALDIRIEVKDA
jgi:hypothetical protein